MQTLNHDVFFSDSVGQVAMVGVGSLGKTQNRLFGFDFPFAMRNSFQIGPEWPFDNPGPASTVGRLAIEASYEKTH